MNELMIAIDLKMCHSVVVIVTKTFLVLSHVFVHVLHCDKSGIDVDHTGSVLICHFCLKVKILCTR